MKKFIMINWHGEALQNWNGDVQEHDTESVLDEVCSPDAYSTNGAVESVEERVRNLQKVVARMINDVLTDDQTERLFSGVSRYTVKKVED